MYNYYINVSNQCIQPKNNQKPQKTPFPTINVKKLAILSQSKKLKKESWPVVQAKNKEKNKK